MIKRQSKFKIKNILKQNKSWKILDLGCGDRPFKSATDVADTRDMSGKIGEKKFKLLTKNQPLPYADKEFDFVICSHVIEHVDDVLGFVKEIERIGKQGYIELPSRLEDNFIYVNQKDHKWWFKYDDDNQKLVFSEKKEIIKPLMSVSLGWKFRENFRESFVTELYWEDQIEVQRIDSMTNDIVKISRYNILKKFISYNLRTFLKIRG